MSSLETLHYRVSYVGTANERSIATYHSFRRTNGKLAIPLPHTNFMKNSFSHSGAVVCNILPIDRAAAGELFWGLQGWLQTILLKIYLYGTYVKQALSLTRFLNIVSYSSFSFV